VAERLNVRLELHRQQLCVVRVNSSTVWTRLLETSSAWMGSCISMLARCECAGVGSWFHWTVRLTLGDEYKPRPGLGLGLDLELELDVEQGRWQYDRSLEDGCAKEQFNQYCHVGRPVMDACHTRGRRG